MKTSPPQRQVNSPSALALTNTLRNAAPAPQTPARCKRHAKAPRQRQCRHAGCGAPIKTFSGLVTTAARNSLPTASRSRQVRKKFFTISDNTHCAQSPFPAGRAGGLPKGPSRRKGDCTLSPHNVVLSAIAQESQQPSRRHGLCSKNPSFGGLKKSRGRAWRVPACP
jgi:hypothetical protein